MSNANQETIADIVREMRTLGRLDEKSTDKIPRTLQALGLRTYADRIEAAAKREREAVAEAAQVCGEIGEMIGMEATREKSSRVGNAAKMREALRQVSRVAVEMTRKTVTGESEDRKTVDEWALRLCDIVSATLAAPPRNCDVGTDEEQSRRYEELCDRHTCGSRCSASGCPMYEHDCSPFAWGQMPYEEGGAK